MNPGQAVLDALHSNERLTAAQVQEATHGRVPHAQFVLDDLVAQGWVEPASAASGASESAETYYSLTEAGHAEWERQIEQPG